MASLISLTELSVWAQQDIDAGDRFAKVIMESASDRVRDAAQQPTWTISTAPARARQICAHLAARSYRNPDSLTRENIGPLGEGRAEDLARALHLTAAEVAELARMVPADLVPQQGGVMWIQPIRETTLVNDSDILIGNLSYGHPDDLYYFGG